MKKIRNELSFTSVILMLLVILIHVLSEPLSGYMKSSLPFALASVLHRLSSFAVQGFIFLSGLKLFLNFKEKFSYVRFYVGRLKRVVLPYLIVYVIFFIYLSYRKFIVPSASLFVNEFFAGGLVTHFYFVIIICQFYLLMPLWRLIYKKASPVIVLPVSLVLMLMLKVYLPEIVKTVSGIDFAYNARVFTTYLFYFVSGIYAAKYYDAFVTFLREHRAGISALFGVSGIITAFASWSIESGFRWFSWADMFHVIYCFAAILFLSSLALLLTDRLKPDGKALDVMNAASYNVYLIHPLLIFICDNMLDVSGISSVTFRLIIRLLFTYVLSLAICSLIEILKRKIRKT